MDEQPGAELRFEPCAFRRHDLTGIRDIHELPHGDGVHGKSDGRAFRIDLRAQVIRAADAADKIDAFARARIVDAENRGEDIVLQETDIEARDRVGTGRNIEFETEPVSAQIHRHMPRFGRRGRGGGLEAANMAHANQKFFGMQSVQIRDEPVVGENFQLVLRKEHRRKPIVILLARVTRVRFAPGQSHTCRPGRTVMTVGNVGMGNGSESRGYCRAIRHAPHGVLHAVRRGEIEEGRACRRGLHQRVDLRSRFEGEEDRFDVRGERGVETDAIIFFFRPCLFVLLDQTRSVFVGMADGGDSGLRMIAHDLSVEINLRRGLADQFAFFLHADEIFPRLLVDFSRVGIDALRHGGFRAHRPQEAVRLGRDDLPRFGGIEDVVGG